MVCWGNGSRARHGRKIRAVLVNRDGNPLGTGFLWPKKKNKTKEFPLLATWWVAWIENPYFGALCSLGSRKGMTKLPTRHQNGANPLDKPSAVSEFGYGYGRQNSEKGVGPAPDMKLRG